MSGRKKTGGVSPLQEEMGNRSILLAEGVQLLLERMSRHESALARAAELSATMTPSARNALTRMAKRLSLSKDQTDPARVLLAVQTYYALVVKLATSVIIERAGHVEMPRLSTVQRDDYERIEAGHRAIRCGVNAFPDAPLWAWYLDVWDRRLETWLQGLARRFHKLDLLTVGTDPAAGHDLFGTFYMSLFPKQVRHALGEHYTPAWLADHVLEQVGIDDAARGQLLDPTCGSGVFLLRALARLRNKKNEHEDGRRIVERIVGMDVNPLAVLAARANYLIAIRDRLDPRHPIAAPIHHRDVVLQEPREPAFDFVVGNPPWLAWDHLPDKYRDQTKKLWQRYGLFSLSGTEARHGGGKKDLAMLVLFAAADRYLRESGRLGMVVTQTLFQTRGAGDGFRRFRLGEDGVPLKVLRVDDLVDVQPFDTASNWTATIVLEKGLPTVYPVPYQRWSRQDDGQAESASHLSPCLTSRPLEASPVDPARPQSPWFVRPVGLKVGIDQLTRPSDYTAHLGANTGGANGVYWLKLLGRDGENVEVENIPGHGKQVLPTVRALLEPDLLYPLVRWSDVGRFRAVPSANLLLVQDLTTRRGIDEDRLREAYPRTYAYLNRFESQLRRRAAYRRYQESAPFYSMYNVGEYTVVPHKVVWRRMDRLVRAAVLETRDIPFLGSRPVLCQETCAMIATECREEAHYLAALLNSSVVGFLTQAHNVRGGKGFGSPGMLEYLGIRRFDIQDANHQELASLGRAAHQAQANGHDLRPIEQEIDTKAALVYKITPAEARVLAECVENAK